MQFLVTTPLYFCNMQFLLPHYSAVKCHNHLQPTPYSYLLHIASSTVFGMHHLPPGVIPDGIHSKTTGVGRVKRSQL